MARTGRRTVAAALGSLLLASGSMLLPGCGTGELRSTNSELARPSLTGRDDLLQSSLAALQARRAEDALAGFARYLQRFPADPGRAEAELGFARSLLLLERPAEARSVLEELRRREPGTRAATHALMETARSFVVEARGIYPHVDQGVRQMVPLAELFHRQSVAGRPFPVGSQTAQESRVRLEGLLALARATWAQAAIEAVQADDRARARIERARLELLHNESVAPVTLLAQAASEAADPAIRAEALLLRATTLAFDPAATRQGVLDAFAAAGAPGAALPAAKSSRTAPAAAEQTGLALNENVRLVFRNLTADLTRDIVARAKLAAATLAAQSGGTGMDELARLAAAGLSEDLALAARFALATSDQLRNREATVVALQALLPDLAATPSLQLAALAILGQYALVEQSDNQPATAPAGDRLAFYANNTSLLSRAVQLNRNLGFPNPDLDARFLQQNPAPVQPLLAIATRVLRLTANVPARVDLTAPASLALPGRVSDPFHFNFAGLPARSAEGSVSFETRSGTLPPGLRLDPGGVLVGSPQAPGRFPLAVEVTRSDGASDVQSLELEVVPVGLSGPRVLVLDSESASTVLSASGGQPPYTFRQREIDLAFPLSSRRVTLSESGVLAHAPGTAPLGNVLVAMELADAAGSASLEFVLVLGRAPVAAEGGPVSGVAFRQPPPAGDLRLPAATAGTPYPPISLAEQLLATGSAQPDSWAAATPLPQGLELSEAGTLSGTPTLPGLYNVRFTARSASGLLGTRYLDLLVRPVSSSPAPFVAFMPGGSSLAARVGVSGLVATLATLGGAAPVRWGITSGALPAGLELSPAGEISGLPSSVTSVELTVRAIDASGAALDQRLRVRTVELPATSSPLSGPRYFPLVADVDGDGQADLLGVDGGEEASVDFPGAAVALGRSRLEFFRGTGQGLPAAAASLEGLMLPSSAQGAPYPNLLVPPLSIETGGQGRRLLLAIQPSQTAAGSLAITRLVSDRFESPTLFQPAEPIAAALSSVLADLDGSAATPARLILSALVPGGAELFLYSRADAEAAFEGAIPAEYRVAARLSTLDLDGDGRLDLLAQSLAKPGAAGTGAVVLRGDGDRRFSSGGAQPLAALGEDAATSVTVCRIDGDAADDAAFASRALLLSALGSGGPRVVRSPAARIQNPRFAASGDFDGDGHTDLAFASNAAFFPNRSDFALVDQLLICLGDGQGAFHTLPAEVVDGHVVGLAAGRFDADARDDLVIATDQGVVVRLTSLP